MKLCQQKKLFELHKMLIKVRSTEGSETEITFPKDVDIDKVAVKELKGQVIEKLGIDTNTKNLRLIYSGKLLDPPSALLSQFKIPSGAFVHAVVSNKVERARSNRSSANRGNQGSRVLGQSGDDSGDEHVPPQPRTTLVPTSSMTTEQLAALRGLDSLMRPGAGRHPLDSEEVRSLRAYFQQDILDFAAQRNITRASVASSGTESHHGGGDGGGDADDFQRRMEDAWMAAQGPQSEFHLNLRARALFSRQPLLGGGGDPRLFGELLGRLGALHGVGGFLPQAQASVGGRERGRGRGRGRGRRNAGAGTGSGSGTGTGDEENANGEDDDEEEDDGEDDEEDFSQAMRGSSSRAFSMTGAGGVYGGGSELGSWRDFLYGVLMGFALGFMMVFCIWDRNVSHRQKLGILAGIMMQVMLSSWQQKQIAAAAVAAGRRGGGGGGSVVAEVGSAPGAVMEEVQNGDGMRLGGGINDGDAGLGMGVGRIPI